MIWEIWISLALVIFIACFLFMIRRGDQRKLKGRTRDLLSPSLREEIERERGEAAQKKKKFEEAMKTVEIAPEKTTLRPKDAIKPD